MGHADAVAEQEGGRFSPEAEWVELFDKADAELRRRVYAVVSEARAEIVQRFYAELVIDPLASQFLAHGIVEARLNAGLQHWIDALFASGSADDVAAASARQRQAGMVHARVRLPIGLVSRGARMLKRWIWALLDDDEKFERGERQVAMAYVSDLIDIAIEVMNTSFLSDVDRSSRSEEAYRLMSLSQDLALERERQRAALLEWNQQAFYAIYRNPPVRPARISRSEFGLWLEHKASFIFEDASEVEQIGELVNEIDARLARLSDQPGREEATELMALLEGDVGQIKFLLAAVFDRFLEVENGRDVLTKLLNRRFLDSVLLREIEIARRTGAELAVLLVDVDHFKKVNDGYGHSIGDMVLQNIAATVVDGVRSGDFVFRYGGEEILVLVAGADAGSSIRVAESLRRSIEQVAVPLGDGKSLRVTASFGVAVYDGHPDYQHLVERADQALYEAKRGGRNRCVLAP